VPERLCVRVGLELPSDVYSHPNQGRYVGPQLCRGRDRAGRVRFERSIPSLSAAACVRLVGWPSSTNKTCGGGRGDKEPLRPIPRDAAEHQLSPLKAALLRLEAVALFTRPGRLAVRSLGGESLDRHRIPRGYERRALVEYRRIYRWSG
jgi:hypothetical protein